MKKTILLGALSLCLFLTACNKEPVSSVSSTDSITSSVGSSTSQVENDSIVAQSSKPQKQDSAEQSNEENKVTDVTDDNLKILHDKLVTYKGEEYLQTMTFMPAEDVIINGENCPVYQIGIDNPEKFTTLDWYAISKTGTVYWLDIVRDEWFNLDAFYNDTVVLPFLEEEAANCIYVLNEYVRDEFSVEYYDTPEEVKQAIFKSELVTDIPDKLIGSTQEIPEGYYADPLARIYYPVYSFDNFDSLVSYYSDYFTASAMEEVKIKLEYSFLEIDGQLYLVRGGMGYGAVSLDFDSIDYANLTSDGIAIVDILLFGEKDGKYEVKFEHEGVLLKIDSFK